jgi:DNA-binding response OmpR family regulator
VPSSFPVERVVVGELHLLRGRLDETLVALAGLVGRGEPGGRWSRSEEAARLARRALAAALQAAPPLESREAAAGELRVGGLRIDQVAGRQWYSEVEFELSPLHQRLLVALASDPYRVFSKDELLVEVWRRAPNAGTNAVNTSVSRLRRALVRAGAPRGQFMLSLHGVGWALTRP